MDPVISQRRALNLSQDHSRYLDKKVNLIVKFDNDHRSVSGSKGILPLVDGVLCHDLSSYLLEQLVPWLIAQEYEQ